MAYVDFRPIPKSLLKKHINFKTLYDLSDLIKDSIGNVDIECSFKIDETEFNGLKEELNNISKHLEEKKHFNNKNLEIKLNNVNFKITNKTQEEKDERDEELRVFVNELYNNKVNIYKIFLLDAPCFSVKYIEEQQNKIKYAIYTPSASSFYKKRRLLIEKRKEKTEDYITFNSDINLEFPNNNNIQRAINTVRINFENKKQKFDFIRNATKECKLGVFIYHYPVEISPITGEFSKNELFLRFATI